MCCGRVISCLAAGRGVVLRSYIPCVRRRLNVVCVGLSLRSVTEKDHLHLWRLFSLARDQRVHFRHPMNDTFIPSKAATLRSDGL